MIHLRMMALMLALLMGGLVTRAADEEQAGSFKLFLPGQDGHMTPLWIVKLQAKDGKWTGEVVDTAQGLPGGGAVTDVKASGDNIHFTLKLGAQELSFDGKMPKEKGQRILGSFFVGRQKFLTRLEPTKLASLKDRYAVAYEALPTAEGAEVFDLIGELLRQAGAKKAKPEEVRGWADRGYKAAESYGTRWQREIALQAAESLGSQENFATVALEYARRAERLLDPKDDDNTQIRILEALVGALRKAGKNDEIKEFQNKINRLEARADEDFFKKIPPVKPDKFNGRKGESTRAVLVELFTGAQCPPCVAADLGFDALGKTYKPTDVVLLQYHLHIPGPDPLTTPDSVARGDYYREAVEGTPSILFNGKAEAAGGGFVQDAKGKYKEYREAIDPLLEKPAKVKLKLTATRKGDKIDATAETSDLDKPGDKIRLRMVLVEEEVRYVGGNQMRLHHHVVRGFLGNTQGLPLTKETGKKTLSVEVDKLRQDLDEYLTEFAAKGEPFHSSRRPLDLKKLLVVAFIQNDETKEVLQAVQVPVGGDDKE